MQLILEQLIGVVSQIDEWNQRDFIPFFKKKKKRKRLVIHRRKRLWRWVVGLIKLTTETEAWLKRCLFSFRCFLPCCLMLKLDSDLNHGMIGNERISKGVGCLEGRWKGDRGISLFLLVLTHTHHTIIPPGDGHTDYWHLGITQTHAHAHVLG